MSGNFCTYSHLSASVLGGVAPSDHQFAHVTVCLLSLLPRGLWNTADPSSACRNTPATESGQQLCLEGPYNDTGCYGGHARLATICKEAKAANPATLCIDAGDEFLGTAWDILFQGQQTPPVLAAAGTDVMATSNHEFDYGVFSLCLHVNLWYQRRHLRRSHW